MEFKDLEAQALWAERVKINDVDLYSKATIDYARAWAELMEQKISEGAELEDIANQTSHDADTDGITGCMYGCAVAELSHVWKHGERLRKWHNLAIQIKDEGEKANIAGSVLNPAILIVE